MKSIIENFGIYGLYGYKNITLTMTNATTIVVAENGMGKTTLLSALNQILTGEVNELKKLDFQRIDIKFFDDELFSLSKEDIMEKQVDKLEELYGCVSEYMEYQLFLEEIENYNPESKEISGFTRFLSRNSSYSLSEIQDELVLLKKIDKTQRPENIDVFSKIKEKLKDVEILYLPTYRRVEKSELKNMRGFKNDNTIRPSSKPRKMREIEFGLSDVEFKLKAMSESVERQSNIGYRSLSATMLEDLIKGFNHTADNKKRSLPDIEDLSRFLIRVANRGQRTKLTSTLEDINQLYKTGDVKKNVQLVYFLNKLNKIINITKEKELMIERFVDVCNKYLSVSSDSKTLTFDARSLTVIVNDEFTSKPIKLDDLSSGEKQIISLMSHLYLDDTKKIILIDEPELSLSIEWQRMVLPDIDESKNILQVLAITHSPFVFDNDLSANAIMLDVEKVKL
ncbi:AAA family ATPase [Rahnella sp. R3(2024)]|uniref:AAA family ATPase n=1 Tax=Rahnella sp. R3(2024) TaxID=3163550 RepID=UPI0036F0AE6A